MPSSTGQARPGSRVEARQVATGSCARPATGIRGADVEPTRSRWEAGEQAAIGRPSGGGGSRREGPGGGR
ncbi:hypothetical protein SVEN_1385 [Streptomyces venezuelae ATCC 10712]|uniref:Uncharacterized protein n=1 Tax=Streptomyces venezuelae (strain ATCC 10712 / CBS 650.69 / DSM 40230 / JCM 4526 / NBRC 13096 / PD 04745) TaxID=953739 RepID=F2RF92_STRVP|nr:hypothetical protein SVEN_1385 [Streptomyces venezuelae ATCC 10712]